MRPPRPLTLSIQALLLSVGTLATTHAQTSSYFYQAPTGPGGTWNLYEYVLTGTSFMGAHDLSKGIAHPLAGPVQGFLTDIGSAFENAAVNQMSYRADAWIGLTDRAGVAPGASEGNFRWINGAPVGYTNWNVGEPNNAGTGEDAGQLAGGGGWNDNRSGFGVDGPVIDPGNTDESGGPNFRYVRKWSTASATPLPGIRSAAALSFAGSLAAMAPESTPGAFGVREVRGLTLEGNLYDTVNKALSGAGTISEAQRARLDAADPDSNANGGPIIGTPPLPFISDTPGTADDNIITIANGQVVVPSSGEWTIQVRSDDGFALRVVGQTFTSVNGLGQIDPLDSSTMFFYGGTGDANTRGVLTLAAGVYDIEFVHWEGGGGAYYEVTTAKGAFTSGAGAQWLAMGDGSLLQSTLNPLRLTADAIVRTAAETASATADTIAQARALLTAAETASATNNGTANLLQLGDGQAIPFPTGTPADNFATKLLGSFILDDSDGTAGESFTITFGIFSDDGSQLRILGRDFDLATDFTADGVASLVDVNGDMSLTADYFTGNTNAFGRITLLEGTYDFEAIMFEGTGGANFSIAYAIGDKTATGLDATFVPLSTQSGVPANQGWEVVPEPSTGLLALMGSALIGLRRRRRN